MCMHGPNVCASRRAHVVHIGMHDMNYITYVMHIYI